MPACEGSPAKPSDSVVANRNKFFARMAALPTTEHAIRQVLELEFPELVVATSRSRLRDRRDNATGHVDIVHEDVPWPGRSCDGAVGRADAKRSADGQLKAAWPSLQSVHGCFDLVHAYEKRNGVRFDWLVRTRFDLGYFQPLPPLSSFSPGAVHLPYTSLPIADTFAIVPRRFAEAYFKADEACTDCRTQASEKTRHAGSTELVLINHLLRGLRGSPSAAATTPDLGSYPHAGPDRRGTVQLHDFPISIVRPDPDTSCQAVPSFHVPCMFLEGSGAWDSGHFNDSQAACSAMATLASASRCDDEFRDGRRGSQLVSADEAAQWEDGMVVFVDDFVSQNLTTRIALPTTHEMNVGTDEISLRILFVQHAEPTERMHAAMVCLFLHHLGWAHTQPHDRAAPRVSSRRRRAVTALLGALPRQLARCYIQDDDSRKAVARLLHAASNALWTGNIRFELAVTKDDADGAG